MVIGFALAGTVDIDILNEPIGTTADGQSVTLAMVWPSATEIDAALATASSNGDFDVSYDEAEQSIAWKNLKAPTTALYPWDASSTYLKRPPFADFGNGPRLGHFIAHPIMVLGDDVTTDHISPAGAIAARSEAGRYLIERGDNPTDLNVFSARRGNWEAMVRGLFTNKTVENLLLPQIPPGSTIHAPSGQILPLPAAAEMYRAAGDPVVLVAGERYGMGSSRDWAAKGVALLGVRAVLASSFERIHRWNLIGMGILPLRLPAGIGPKELQLQPGDRLEISAASETIKPRGTVLVIIRRPSGEVSHYDAMAAIETTAEISILRAGGILPLILEKTMSASG
jgi:aconitate hydratase